MNNDQLVEAIKDLKSNLIIVDNVQLRNDVIELLAKNKDHVGGDYEFCTIYQTKENQRYVLIHAFYLKEDIGGVENMDKIVNKDTYFIHEELVKSGLKLDYLFVVPYYEVIWNRNEGSICGVAVVTNERKPQ